MNRKNPITKMTGSFLIKILITALLLKMNLIFSQDTIYLSLPVIIQKIETSYPEILMYESKIKSIQSLSEGTKSWMPPAASFGLDRFPYQLSNINMKDDPMNQAGLMFSLEQMIPNPSKLNAKTNYINSLTTIQQNNSGWKKIFSAHVLSFIITSDMLRKEN